MSYEPKTKSSYAKGTAGIAKVYFSQDKRKVKIVFKPQEEGGEAKSFVLDRDACPADLQVGEWSVNISSQGDKMIGFHPVIGTFVVKTLAFPGGNDNIPKPKTKDVKFERGGKTHEYSYDYFLVLLEIVEPAKFAGIEIPYILRYNFEPDLFEGKPVVAYAKGGSKYTDWLKEYLNVAGTWDLGALDWKDNILPDMQKRILHADKKFQLTMKDGWIVPGSLLPYDAPDADPDDMVFDADESEKALNRIEETPQEFVDDDEIDFEPA